MIVDGCLCKDSGYLSCYPLQVATKTLFGLNISAQQGGLVVIKKKNGTAELPTGRKQRS